ncbi:hypothetical protein IC582_024553 [Cucumis melo]
MAFQRPMPLLLVLLLLNSLNMSIAKEKKFPKNKNGKPKLPNPNNPVVSFQKFRVEIHNDLDMYLLDSRCYSKDNDLGLHVLFPDEQQNWSFEGNWDDTTDFHCRLEWENGYLEFDSFISDPEFVTDHCSNRTCIWSARQSGVYLNDAEDQETFFDYWEMLR